MIIFFPVTMGRIFSALLNYDGPNDQLEGEDDKKYNFVAKKYFLVVKGNAEL